MKERIESRLKCMIGWLESEIVNYTKEDLIKDTNRIMNAIYESEFVDIITVAQSNELTELVIKYVGKYM